MYIWVDLWDKRCWVAIQIEWVVIPKWVYPRVDIVSELKKIQKDYHMTHIVVWLPYDLYNIDHHQLKKTQKFIEKLKDIFPDTQIIGHDERLSSFEAQRVSQSISKTKQKRDDIAAAIILESYLSSHL